MSPHKRNASAWGALSALALVGQLGLTMALPIVAGVWIGAEADRRLGTRALFLLGGLLLGLAAGGFGAYRIIVKETRWTR